MGLGGRAGRGTGAARSRRHEGRAADPQRDLDRGYEPDPGARGGDPRQRTGRAHPRRHRVVAGCRAVRDGRLGRRRRRDRLAEGLDGRTGAGHGRRLAARVGRHGDGEDAALLPRPSEAPRGDDLGRDALDPRHRRRLPGRRGHPADERGRPGRGVRAARRLRRRHAGRPRGARLRAVRDADPSVEDGHRRVDPGGPRLEGVQRRDEAPAGGARRGPGQADREGVPRRPPRLGDARRDPRRAVDDRGRLARVGPHGRARSGRRGRRASRGGGRAPAGLTATTPAASSPANPASGDAPATTRVLVAEQIAPEGIDALRARHEVEVRTGLSAEQLREVIGDFDALIVRSQVEVDAALIAAAPRLQVIGRAGVGVDNVDLDAATRAGITVVNAPTGNTIAAAEHTIALLLALARRIPAADASIRRGEWSRGSLQGVQLRGRTLGIIGLGKIGMAIAERARALGMTLLGSDPYVTAEQAALRGVELVDLERLLERSDAVTIHVPLTRATTGLIGARAIARMKPGAFVLNVARGGIVDEPALAWALREGRLGGAGIDVFETEPPTGSPLLDAPNTVLTPHLGASTIEAQVAVAEEIAEQVLDVLDGRPARYAVNAPLLSAEAEQTIGPFLPLAEKLGRFVAQFARTGIGTITVELAGELAQAESSPLTAAVLRGLLETVTTERVNLVNAGILAKARGISVVERRTADAGGFSAAITVSGSIRGG